MTSHGVGVGLSAAESAARGVKVLVVYSRVGGGHQSAARALAAAFEAAGGGRVRAIDSDVYLERSGFPVNRFPALYARIARSHPRLWAALFHSTDGGRFEGTHLLRPFMEHQVGRLLEQERPDLVVSVMPVVNGLLARAVARHPERPWFEVVLTDWCGIHQTWVARGVDHYTAPTEPARRDLVRYGARPERVEVVGIPVRAEFTAGAQAPTARERLIAELRLDPGRFTILTMVGAEGSPQALRNLQAVAELPLDAQLIALCGRNERLKRQVEELPGRLPVRVLGFVAHVADLMRSADLLITKAGGMTLAEAFCCRVPTIVNDVLPGQERGNTEYAFERGAIEYARSPAQLVELVTELRASRERRVELIERAAALARPDAAPRIAEAMLARLQVPV